MNALALRVQEIVQWFLMFPGPLIPVLLCFALFRKRMRYDVWLFLSGTLSLVIFAFCVTLPYNFQGYATLSSPSVGEGLGLTRLPVIGDFAYLYSFKWSAFVWLLVGLLATGIGNAPSKKTVVNYIIKGSVVVIYAFCFVQVPNYAATINVVLE